MIITINLVRNVRKRPCEDCLEDIENDDQADLSFLLFRRWLCEPCYARAKRNWAAGPAQ